MRVIAGTAGGRRLSAPKGMSTRPTIDRVKEAIFSTIAPYIADTRVLDAFSGTGSLAIEALSRGAKEALLIEKDPKAFKVLKGNIDSLAMTCAKAVCGDCLKLLSRMKDGRQFDLIFLDPPYNKGYLDKVIKIIAGGDLLSEGGIIIIETSSRENEAFDPTGFKFLKKADYGDTSILYLGKAERGADSGKSED